MKRKGALMPHGTPKFGGFQVTMFNIKQQINQQHNNHYQQQQQQQRDHHSNNHRNQRHRHQIHNNHRHIKMLINNYRHVIWPICILFLFLSLPCDVLAQDSNGNNGGSQEAAITTSEVPTTTPFDYSTRGQKKYSDKCESTQECGFPGSVCDPGKKTCQCGPEYSATNQIDKCGKLANYNESCSFNEECEDVTYRSYCSNDKCTCNPNLVPIRNSLGGIDCDSPRPGEPADNTYIDPTMIGILVVMALMFITICVVLRLFSKARWRENRTIFNTPNPRLMNVSLLRDNKLLHGHERRGSKMSVRAPSRQPSMASLRPHSPNPSLGSRRGSRGSSNASATSMRSTRSLNGVSNGNDPSQKPLRESVTVEITEPKA